LFLGFYNSGVQGGTEPQLLQFAALGFDDGQFFSADDDDQLFRKLLHLLFHVKRLQRMST
jgi:hypothetical protein